jgi:FHS family glucose/mannose:H+ symporter-like MFS transporter
VIVQASQARRALGGFFLSGLLFAFPGAILPAWGHYITSDYLIVGNYFLSMIVGILASSALAHYFLEKQKLSAMMTLACAVACAALLTLAAFPTGSPAWWRLGPMFLLGCGGGILNLAVFRGISASYRHDPAGTVNLAGTLFGMGSVVTALLLGGTFSVYTVPSILILFALIPGFGAGLYARVTVPMEGQGGGTPARQTLRDFRSPTAVLLALLLFFQFGNEWAVAGWLTLFLIQRLGISPASSLAMLSLYWLALVVGRIAVLAILPRVRHGRLLMGSALAALFGCTILASTNNGFGAVTGILLIGGGFASVYPLVVEKIGMRFPSYHPGFFNGIFSLGITGGLLAPWSLGFFVNWWGIRAVMILPQLGTLMVVVLLLLIWAEAKFTARLALKAGAE